MRLYFLLYNNAINKLRGGGNMRLYFLLYNNAINKLRGGGNEVILSTVQ